MPSPIRLGIIGLSASGSWASRSHLGYLQANPDKYQIVALQNSSKRSAEAAAQKYGLSNVQCYGDANDLAADPNVDMVVVSVKVPDHRAVMEPALKAGKQVFSEWPLGRDLEEAEYFGTLAKQHGVKRTMVGLQARQNPAIRKAKAMVAAGELGEIIGTRMEGCGGIFGPSMSENGYEYLLPIEAGANLVTIPAGHAIDALCFVLGEWKDLQSTLVNRIPKYPFTNEQGNVVKVLEKTSHDYMAVIGTLISGGVASVVYQGGKSQTGRDFFWEINGTKGCLILEGSHGHVQMFDPSLKFVKAGVEGAQPEVVNVDKAGDFSYNVGIAWNALVDEGDGTVTTFEDAILRHRMIEAIYRSNERGTREAYV